MSSGKTAHRAFLPVYAILQNFPEHAFEPRPGQSIGRDSPCGICSGPYGYPEEITENDGKTIRLGLTAGGIFKHSVYYYYRYLHQANLVKEIPAVQAKDMEILSAILQILQEAGDEQTLKEEVQYRIGQINGFTSNAEQRKALLETPGYCSILETPAYKGLLHRYTNLSTAPRKTRSSDWKYPADWWQGKDGVNGQALSFWFGDFIWKKKKTP